MVQSSNLHGILETVTLTRDFYREPCSSYNRLRGNITTIANIGGKCPVIIPSVARAEVTCLVDTGKDVSTKTGPICFG